MLSVVAGNEASHHYSHTVDSGPAIRIVLCLPPFHSQGKKFDKMFQSHDVSRILAFACIIPNVSTIKVIRYVAKQRAES